MYYNAVPASKLPGTLRHRLLVSIDLFKTSEKVLIGKSLTFAEETHQKQFRKPTFSYPEETPAFIVHPMRTALILLEEVELRDLNSICTALLHDVVESSQGKISIGEMETGFGRGIAMMVSIMTKPILLADATAAQKEEHLKIYQQRLKQASVNSRIVRLAAWLDNLREASEWLDKAEQKRMVEETEQFYKPLAENTDDLLTDEIEQALTRLNIILRQ